MNSPLNQEKDDSRYNFPLSPIDSSKSMEKLFQGHQKYNSITDFCPNEISQKQFNLGALARSELFKKKNDVLQKASLQSEPKIVSVNNIDNFNGNEHIQSVTRDVSQIANIDTHFNNFSDNNYTKQGQYSATKIGTISRRFDFNINCKIQDNDSRCEFNSNLFNSTELKNIRSKKMTDEELGGSKSLNNSGNQTPTKLMNGGDSVIQYDSNESPVHTQEKRNIYKQMRIMNQVKVYINKMKSLSLFNIYPLMRKQHFDLIKDSTFYYYDTNKTTIINKKQPLYCFKSILNKVVQSLKCLPIVNPDNPLCIFWDILYGICLLIFFFIIPMELSFDIDFQVFRQYLFFIFLIDMFIQIFKGFYHKGSLVMEQQQIILNYLKGSFIIDVIVITTLTTSFLIWTGFFKFKRLKEIIQRADDYFQIIRRFPIIYELSDLIITIVLIGQIAGCGFHFIAKSELDNDPYTKTWMHIQEIKDKDVFDQYIASIYFAFITMNTVGFGDIYPITRSERIYVIFMTLLSSAVFGYVMNTIGYIFQNLAQKQASFKKRKQDIINFLTFRDINRTLQIKIYMLNNINKLCLFNIQIHEIKLIQNVFFIKMNQILKYIDYQEKTQKDHSDNQEILFKDIPSTLTEEIYQQYYGQYLLQNKIMRLNFSKESIMALSVMMKELYLGPNQYLLKRGVRVTCVYFLLEGDLDFFWTKNENDISFSTINQLGESLGMRCAFTNKKIKYSVRTTKNSTCKLMYFEMEHFKTILQNFPKDYEKFCELRDEIQFNKYSLDTKCQSCNRFNHIFEECPLLNVRVRQRSLVIARHTFPFKQVRQKIKRSKIKLHSLKKKDQIVDSSIQMKIQMFIQHFPEFIQNGQQLFELDINQLFQQIPNFIYIDGEYLPDHDDEQNIDSQADIIQSQASLKGVNDHQKILKNLKVPQEENSIISSQQNQNIPQMVSNFTNQHDNFGSLSSLPVQSQTLINEQPSTVQQGQLQPQYFMQNKLHQPIANDLNTIRTKNNSQIQNSEVSMNQLDVFSSYCKGSEMNQSYFVNVPDLTKNMIANSPYLKKNNDNNTVRSRKSIRGNSNKRKQPNINGIVGVIGANGNEVRKQTIKQNTIVGHGNQDLKMMLLLNEKTMNLLLDFDKMKDFQRYYPRYNAKQIIERYNLIQKRITNKPKRLNISRQHHNSISGVNSKKYSIQNRQSHFFLNNIIKLQK